MADFSPAILEAAARAREVMLTTYGRKTRKPRNVTIWISTDGRRIFIRSGGGLGRHWPQNLMAHGEAQLRLGKISVSVKPRHVADTAEARTVSQLVREKYGSSVIVSRPGDQPTQAETATFELIPVTA